MRDSHTALVPQILDKIEQLQRGPEATQDAQAVLLDTHFKDQLYALELSRYCLESNIQPYINPQEDDPNKHIDAFEARLKQVSMLMILFGSVNANWVRQRLGAALQLSMTQSLAIQSFCVIGLPPAKQPDELNFNLGPIRVQVIDASKEDALRPQLLAPILRSIREGGAT